MMEDNHQLLAEAYFASVKAQLKEVPDARASEFIDELRAHLYAMVEAKRSDGLSEARAWEAAMAEFGEPEQVGRDLQKQWANSAQSEVKPYAMPKWLLFLFPFIACLLVYAVATMVASPGGNVGWQLPVIATITFGCIGYGISSEVRSRGGWKPSTFVGCVYALTLSCLSMAHLQWGNKWEGERGFGMIVLMSWALLGAAAWLRKHESAERPWQFSALLQADPIAAREHRISPLMSLVMGTAGIGIVALGFQFFGLELAILLCFGLVGTANILSRWLSK